MAISDPSARAMPTNVAGITGQSSSSPGIAGGRRGAALSPSRLRARRSMRMPGRALGDLGDPAGRAAGARPDGQRAVVGDAAEQLVEGVVDDVLGAVDQMDDRVGVGLDPLDVTAGSTEKCSPLRQVTAITGAVLPLGRGSGPRWRR